MVFFRGGLCEEEEEDCVVEVRSGEGVCEGGSVALNVVFLKLLSVEVGDFGDCFAFSFFLFR